MLEYLFELTCIIKNHRQKKKDKAQFSSIQMVLLLKISAKGIDHSR